MGSQHVLGPMLQHITHQAMQALILGPAARLVGRQCREAQRCAEPNLRTGLPARPLKTAATALALSNCAAVDAAGCCQAACMACKPGLAAESTCAVNTAGTASLSAPTRLDCCSAAHKLALLIASLLGSARWGQGLAVSSLLPGTEQAPAPQLRPGLPLAKQGQRCAAAQRQQPPGFVIGNHRRHRRRLALSCGPAHQPLPLYIQQPAHSHTTAAAPAAAHWRQCARPVSATVRPKP